LRLSINRAHDASDTGERDCNETAARRDRARDWLAASRDLGTFWLAGGPSDARAWHNAAVRSGAAETIEGPFCGRGPDTG
jgi:hypothetical protein